MLIATDYITNLTALFKFLGSIWGLLAGVSVLFPLSNVLFKVLPLTQRTQESPRGLALLPTQLVTTIASVLTLFVLLQTVASRDLITSNSRATVQISAGVCFLFAMEFLVLYLRTYYRPSPQKQRPYNILYSDFLQLFTYALLFAMLTLAFTVLAYKEYLSQ